MHWLWKDPDGITTPGWFLLLQLRDALLCPCLSGAISSRKRGLRGGASGACAEARSPERNGIGALGVVLILTPYSFENLGRSFQLDLVPF